MEIDGLAERFEFTPEQLQVLQDGVGQPLHVPVDATNKVYLVVEEGLIPTLDDDYIRAGLSHGNRQVESGQEGEWSAEEIKSAGRQLLARRDRSS
ncbi:MAG TPA: hypothetical protein VGM76_12975 [Lacipirellulaceae bacterium]|jgi:hypothetical protein